MNNIVKMLFVACFTVSATIVMAQQKPKKIETSEFEVAGVCGMCEKRIEDAVLVKGVKLAEWNKNTQTLKVIFRTDKISEEKIHELVANAGHDTQKVKAPDEIYKKLPDCCAYRDGVEAH